MAYWWQHPEKLDIKWDLPRMRMSGLPKKLPHNFLIFSSRTNKLRLALFVLVVIAESLNDLCQVQVPVFYDFKLLDEIPIYRKPRPLPPLFQNVVHKESSKMLNGRIVTPETSGWAFPIVLVTRIDGKSRLCLDYTPLNWRFKEDRFPLPNIEEILSNSSCWTLQRDDYIHVQIWYLSVCVHDIWVHESPSNVSEDDEQGPKEYPMCTVYLRDIVVFSKQLADHT